MSTESRSRKVFTRFASSRSMQHQSVFRHDCLRHCALFRERDPRFLQSVLEELSVEIFHAGEVIMTEGHAGDKFYVLNVGKVEVLNGQNVVAVLEGGNSFGEMTLLGVSNVRTCTIRALEFCDCRVLSNRSFQRVLQLFSDEKAFFDGLATRRKADLHRKMSEGGEFSPGSRRSSTSSTRWLASPLEGRGEGPARRAIEAAVPRPRRGTAGMARSSALGSRLAPLCTFAAEAAGGGAAGASGPPATFAAEAAEAAGGGPAGSGKAGGGASEGAAGCVGGSASCSSAAEIARRAAAATVRPGATGARAAPRPPAEGRGCEDGGRLAPPRTLAAPRRRLTSGWWRPPAAGRGCEDGGRPARLCTPMAPQRPLTSGCWWPPAAGRGCEEDSFTSTWPQAGPPGGKRRRATGTWRQAPAHGLSGVSHCLRSFRRSSAPPGLPRPGPLPEPPQGPPRCPELEGAPGAVWRPGGRARARARDGGRG